MEATGSPSNKPDHIGILVVFVGQIVRYFSIMWLGLAFKCCVESNYGPKTRKVLISISAWRKGSGSGGLDEDYHCFLSEQLLPQACAATTI